MALNKIGNDNIYIGGLMSLRNKIGLKNANITHVITVLRMEPNERLFEPFQHLQIHVDDIADENLLEHFPTTNAFIQSGLEGGGGVLVHCAVGKSRSTTVCIAFLLHREPGSMTPREALEFIRRSRPFCEPNDGFMEQLDLYHRMGCPRNVTEQPLYQRWLYRRAVEESVACGRGPELDLVRFEDEHPEADKNTDEITEIKCRKCRRKLATLPFIVPHESRNQNQSADPPPAVPCAHVYLHPLTWMRPSLFPTEQGSSHMGDPPKTPDAPLSGRLTCPNINCASNIGKFAWQGMRCSCGTWVVPAIALARARVDVIDANVKKGLRESGAGIRLRPEMAPAMPTSGRGLL